MIVIFLKNSCYLNRIACTFFKKFHEAHRVTFQWWFLLLFQGLCLHVYVPRLRKVIVYLLIHNSGQEEQGFLYPMYRRNTLAHLLPGPFNFLLSFLTWPRGHRLYEDSSEFWELSLGAQMVMNYLIFLSSSLWEKRVSVYVGWKVRKYAAGILDSVALHSKHFPWYK